MSQQRKNDQQQPKNKPAERTSRGYEINGLWYFELRGGGQKGPFETEAEMQAELNEFIELHEQMNQQN